MPGGRNIDRDTGLQHKTAKADHLTEENHWCSSRHAVGAEVGRDTHAKETMAIGRIQDTKLPVCANGLYRLHNSTHTRFDQPVSASNAKK